jgi:serine/threonine protein kinase
MQSILADKILAIGRRQEQGHSRTHFDCALLKRQCGGEQISEAALAQSLEYLLQRRKPNQKLDVLDLPVGKDKHIEVLYLADRSSNSIARRLFRPGLLHKLASRRARQYIEKEIKIALATDRNVTGQVAGIKDQTAPVISEAKKQQEELRRNLVDPPRYKGDKFKKAHATTHSIVFGSREFTYAESGGAFSHASNEIQMVVDTTGVKYVLKKMPNGTRARNEIGLIQRLCRRQKNKAHLVGIEEVGIIGKDLYVVMPYMDGPDCSKLIEKMHLQEKKELSRLRGRGLLMARRKLHLKKRKALLERKYLDNRIFLCGMAARSVGALSDRHVIHNDMKWENILYDSSLGTRVTDLELAKLKGEKLIKGVRIRDNPRHKAPEIVLAENYEVNWKTPEEFSICPASDVWSLGIMFCELLLGVNPFDPDRTPFGSDIEDRITKHDGILDSALFECLPDDVRNVAEELINSMLNPDPKKRPKIKDVLESPIFHMEGRSEAEMKNRLSSISNGRAWFSAGLQQRKPRRTHGSEPVAMPQIGRREHITS